MAGETAKSLKRSGRRPGRFGNALVDLLAAASHLSDDGRRVLVELIRAIAADTRQARAAVAVMRRVEAAAVAPLVDPPNGRPPSRPNTRVMVGAALSAMPRGNGKQLAGYIAGQYGVTVAPRVASAEAAVLRRRGWDGRLDLGARQTAELVRLVEVIGGDQLSRVVGMVGR